MSRRRRPLLPPDVAAFVRDLGISLRTATWNYRGYTWDGAIFRFIRQYKAEDVLHDVAHWMIAPPERRCLPEFGLGPDPGGVARKDAPLVIEQGAADEEEYVACDVQLALVAGFGLNVFYVMDRY